MADEADISQARMEQEEEFRRRAPRRPELPPKGTCYYCDADLPKPKKFCDRECADGYDFELKMKGFLRR